METSVAEVFLSHPFIPIGNLPVTLAKNAGHVDSDFFYFWGFVNHIVIRHMSFEYLNRKYTKFSKKSIPVQC